VTEPIDQEAAALYEPVGRALVEWSTRCLNLRRALIKQVPGGAPIVGPDVTAWKERTVIKRFFETSVQWKQRRDANGFAVSTDGGPEVVHPTGTLPDDTKVAKSLKKWLERLYLKRNRLVHDAWSVGQAVTGDSDPVFSAERFDTGDPTPGKFPPSGDSSPEGLLAFIAEVRDADRAAFQFRISHDVRQRHRSLTGSSHRRVLCRHCEVPRAQGPDVRGRVAALVPPRAAATQRTYAPRGRESRRDHDRTT
jgi:hypothetical protein